MKKFVNYFITGMLVVIAVILCVFKYKDYVTNPWTRNGQVQADIIQVTPRISGPIVTLSISDNQLVEAGDLLFEIDPRTFQAELDRTRAQLDITGDNVRVLSEQVEVAKASIDVAKASIEQAKTYIAEIESTIIKNKAIYKRLKSLLEKNAASRQNMEISKSEYEVSVQQKLSAKAELNQAKATLLQTLADLAKARAQLGKIGTDNSQVRAALAAVRQAELNLEFTKVRAPVDGYITNLNIRQGTQAVANQPVLALVEVNNYWITGFFKENTIADIKSGDPAVVTLMTYPDTPLEASVNSIGWGISQQDGSTGFNLLPNISPTFEWIRLAQRVPVRIHLSNVPENIKLRVGTTCSVLVMTGTKGDKSKNMLSPPVAPDTGKKIKN